MQKNRGDSFEVQQTEQLDQEFSEIQAAEEKACIFINDNKRIPKYIDERPSSYHLMNGQKLAFQCKKKCGIFHIPRSSYLYENVREVPYTSNQGEEQSHESERSETCKHQTRYARGNNTKALQRTEKQLNQKSYGLPTYSVSNKCHESSAETLKDKTNAEVINKTIAAASHSNSVTWRAQEPIEIENKYEASKRELDQLKQNFQEFIRQFDPTESQCVTKRENSTQVLSVLMNEKDMSSSSDNYNKATDARSLPSKHEMTHISWPIENKRDQLSAYELKHSDPKHETAMGITLHKLPCKAQANLESYSSNVSEANIDSQQVELGLPQSEFSIIDRRNFQKKHAPNNESKRLKIMYREKEEGDYSKEGFSVSGFANEITGTNLSSVEKYENPTMPETKFEQKKYQRQASTLEEESLEDLENSLKLLEGEKDKLNKSFERMQTDEAAMGRNRIPPVPTNDSLEAYYLQNYMCVYQSPIFEHTSLNSGPLEDTKSIEMLYPSKWDIHHCKSLNSCLSTKDKKDAEIAELNSELKILKTRLCTTCQIQLKMEDDLKENLSKNKYRALSLETAIEEKENQIKDLKQHILDMQDEKDNILLGNIKLLCKAQEAKNEAWKHNRHVADYITINDKLLVLAQRKEEEVNLLAEQVTRLHMTLSKTTEENNYLSKTLKALRNEMSDLREQNNILKNHNDLMTLKLQNNEVVLLKREESLYKISIQLAGVVENQDSLLAESKDLWRRLQDAKYRQIHIETELINSNNVISDLKEKISYRDNEISGLRAELKEIMKQNILLEQTKEAKDKDLTTLQSKLSNLWHKVEALEEEVLIKEGQIAILKGSFSEEEY
ncbi:uncharacterized protein LOC131039650 isoform X2 [Cryptomeria japonica]|uniref:uncharacterized protein LOC131039650 isoform X2 n=1 Tax=Cryptomeria japonica TaxID=3369 RepID=UPI0027DA0BC6|nr:uncharacterized protein LOC131039650 isoform X2 [Cryptomeria japonica]